MGGSDLWDAWRRAGIPGPLPSPWCVSILDRMDVLAELRTGEPQSLERLFPLVYAELRAIAHRQLRARPTADATLSTTALVHDAYLKLVDQSRAQWKDRAHFLAVASLAMRHVLVDRAKARNAAKRGGGRRRITLDEESISIDEQADALLQLNEALDYLGRLEPRKGLLDLLKAYRILRSAGCQCRLLVVGTGPQEREARRYVLTRRLAGVEFLGRVGDDEKAALYRTADVFVSPATGRESFGIVLLEAMAAGTPVVCSDIHGYKGVVRRDREGLLVPPRNPKALAAAVLQLFSNPELAARMGEAGRQRAEDFSWERVTAKVEDYYGFVIRRLASQDALPPGFRAAVPASPRTAAAAGLEGQAAAVQR